MNVEALKQAIRILETIPEANFNMHTFGEKTDCGTVACIAGHCMLDPWFISRGFIPSGCTFLIHADPVCPYNLVTGDTGRLAIQSFFQLEYLACNYLFYNDIETPGEAITRIEAFLKTPMKV